MCSGITHGRVLNGAFHAQRFQKLIHLHETVCEQMQIKQLLKSLYIVIYRRQSSLLFVQYIFVINLYTADRAAYYVSSIFCHHNLCKAFSIFMWMKKR